MVGGVILVAVDASRELTDYALEWAVRNVIKPMDSLLLIAILPPPPPPVAAAAAGNHNFYQFFSRLLKKRSNEKDSWGFVDDMPKRIYDVCVQMMQQLFALHNVVQVHPEVKVIAYAPRGSVAMAAAELGATWVVLDRRLKKEGDCCLKELDCNIVVIDHAIPKILKSSVKFPIAAEEFDVLSDPTVADMLGALPTRSSVPSSNTSTGTGATTTTTTTTTTSSNGTNTHHFPQFTNFQHADTTSPSPHSGGIQFSDQHRPKTEATYRPPTRCSKSQPLTKELRLFDVESPRKSTASLIRIGEERIKSYSGVLKSTTSGDINKINAVKTARQTPPVPPRRSIDYRHSGQKPSSSQSRQAITRRASTPPTVDRTSSVRKAMSLSIKQPPTPPPLCSVCKNNAPIFGRAPRRFSYNEIEQATGGFSRNNFLAKGGYGQVYKGVLADGQVVAVKQHTMLSAQEASEFCSEVEVLSCAQHKNLVMLVGYCIEMEWLLVYEFACNSSLDKHLYGTETTEVLAWHNRMKVALGAARGLRYLHEDCRVGCIVHRDFRPNNILLTHDFEPMVGDFGLARWQTDGQTPEETRVIGAFGYLAPEYTQTGLITEKADVYAFGVVLLELLTGIKATEFSRNAGQKYLPEWSRLFLDRKVCADIIDPRLEKNYVVKEVECMRHASNLCISPHPERRPKMSKVLQILEGDMPNDVVYKHGQSTSFYARQNINGYTTDRQWNENQKLGNNPYQKPSIRDVSLSPSKQSAQKKENQQNIMFKQTIPYSEDITISDDLDLHKSEMLVNEEYQDYLQGSLFNYIQKFIVT